MPIQGLPRVLEKLFESVLLSHDIATWNIFSENNGGLTFRIKFCSENSSHIDLPNTTSYRRKSPSQVYRDNSRSLRRRNSIQQDNLGNINNGENSVPSVSENSKESMEHENNSRQGYLEVEKKELKEISTLNKSCSVAENKESSVHVVQIKKPKKKPNTRKTQNAIVNKITFPSSDTTSTDDNDIIDVDDSESDSCSDTTRRMPDKATRDKIGEIYHFMKSFDFNGDNG